ncbi:SNARE-binding exocyst subunit S6 [Microbotryomycetes sp. JL201]|nr:SNARE-binding exocyst subunit S6 [Microbotryomycetes sp. JL201]
MQAPLQSHHQQLTAASAIAEATLVDAPDFDEIATPEAEDPQGARIAPVDAQRARKGPGRYGQGRIAATETGYIGYNSLIHHCNGGQARSAVEGIRDSMNEIEHNVADPRGQIQGFGKLVEVSVIHRRFTQALDMVTSLRNMYSRLAYVSNLLSQDRSDPLGPSPNLLPIHYHLTELETFRNETLTQARKNKAGSLAQDQLATLERYFERLGETIEAFEAHYFRLARELVELARNGNGAVAVKLAKIAEVEGARDQKALAIRMVKKAGTIDISARFRSVQAEARTIKHYKQKVLEAIRDGCRTSVERSYARHNDNGVAWLEDLEWIFDDLALVDNELVPMFPDDWKIFQVYAKGYHKAMYDFLQTWVKSGPDAGSLLRLSQFTKEYKSTMVKELEIPADWLEPPLLDGKEQDLLNDYFTLIVKKMDEWTSNLMKTEVQEFMSREQPPEIDVDGQYGMQGAVILFQMLNQQVDLALDSNQASVLARVVEEANRVMRGVQKQWLALLNSEFKKQVDKPDEVPGGLVEYVMALANDQIKSADFTEALNLRLEPLVSAKYKGVIADKLNDAMDGYLDVAKRCVQVLIDVIFNDLKPATKVLFQQQWYTDDPMVQIVETLKDYMVEDYQTHLNPNLFELLVEDMVDTFLVTYLTSIKRASKIRIPQALDKMRRDVDKAKEFFRLYKSDKDLEAYFDVLETVLTLMSSSKMMVFLDYWPFRKKYGPNLGFVENLMKARDDLDRSAVGDIMESVKRKVSNEILSEPETPSIFSRLPAK